MTDAEAKSLVEELQAIKKLLILQLLAMGYKQKQIASSLGISEATLSRMVPKGFSKDLPKKSAGGFSGSVED